MTGKQPSSGSENASDFFDECNVDNGTVFLTRKKDIKSIDLTGKTRNMEVGAFPEAFTSVT